MFSGYNNEKVLVTGGAGFVGSNLTDKLIELGAKVTVLDDLSTGTRTNIEHLEEVNFIKGSIIDYELVNKVTEDMKFIFHLAARNIIESTVNPMMDCKTNIMGTLNLLLAARRSGLDKTRIVYTSSTSVYGNPKHLPINEEDGINTLTPYSVSKLAGENYCYAFYESYGLQTVILRYSNVYGKGQYPQNAYCGVVARFFKSCAAGEPLKVHGDGEQSRDFTYIEDVVDATLVAGICDKAVGGIYNIGTGVETKINDLAFKIKALCPVSPGIEYVDRRDIDNIRRRVLNIEKIRRELRWVPRFNLDSGLKRTAEWLTSKKLSE